MKRYGMCCGMDIQFKLRSGKSSFSEDLPLFLRMHVRGVLNSLGRQILTDYMDIFISPSR